MHIHFSVSPLGLHFHHGVPLPRTLLPIEAGPVERQKRNSLLPGCTGARVGLSEHTDDNRRVFSFRLTREDNADIDAVLERSNGRRLITSIGDCGAEYR